MYQQINLYQPIFRRQRQIFSALAMFQAVGVLAVALLVLHGYGLWKVVGLEAEAVQLEGRVKADTAQLARLDPTVSLVRRREVEVELERLNSTLSDQQRLIEVLEEQPLGTTEGFSDYLAALARRHRGGLWLTELTINGGSQAIELVGQTVDPGLVPGYLLELGKEEALSGQRFDRFEIERADDGGDATFRVSSRAAADDQWRVEPAARRR
jgi:hypothetical protein